MKIDPRALQAAQHTLREYGVKKLDNPTDRERLLLEVLYDMSAGFVHVIDERNKAQERLRDATGGSVNE